MQPCVLTGLTQADVLDMDYLSNGDLREDENSGTMGIVWGTFWNRLNPVFHTPERGGFPEESGCILLLQSDHTTSLLLGKHANG